jgi:CheY-like chemotaxis protein
MDGYEAAAEIRRREKDGRRTRIVAMTANALAGDRERCLSAGMDEYISKPIRLEALEAVLERLVPEVPVAAAGTPAPRAGDEPVDLARLRRMCRSENDQQRIVRLFFDEARGHMEQLTRAIDQGDLDTARRAAHTLVGASANLGFVSVAEGMRELEGRLRQDLAAGAAARVASLAAEIERARVFLARTIGE